MAGTFKFELVTPEKRVIPRTGDDPRAVVSAEATEVVVPGLDGQFTVLAGHAPMISALRPGIVEIALTSGRRRVFVRGGIVEVEPDQLTVLAQNFLDLDDANPEAMAAEKKAAEALAASATNDADKLAADTALQVLNAL